MTKIESNHTEHNHQNVETASFEDFDLDNRLIRAIAKLDWSAPTLVQAELNKTSKEGKSAICRAKTGSGKTAAYLLPILSNILKDAESFNIIISPTQELCTQICHQLRKLTLYFDSEDFKFLNLSKETINNDLLANIIVGTPDKIHEAYKKQTIKNKTIDYLVVDEADLVFAFGYKKIIKEILVSKEFKAHQYLLISATVNKDILELNQIVLKELHLLDLQDAQLDPSNISEYNVPYNKDENFLILYYILKMSVIKGKIIVFVNDVHQCYRLKLFLIRFDIRCCALHSQLPFVSRYHIVQQFNSDEVDLLIAVDSPSNNAAPASNDLYYGVSRGVDFKNASYVINFDMPNDYDTYVHRIGRTARANQTGVAITFYSASNPKNRTQIQELTKKRKENGYEIKEYDFYAIKEQIESFKYRVNDVLSTVTKNVIYNTRIEELKNEFKNSEKIKEFYSKNLDLDSDKFELKIDHIFDQKKRIVAPYKGDASVSKIPQYLKKNTNNALEKTTQPETNAQPKNEETTNAPPKKKLKSKFVKPPTGRVRFMSKRKSKKLTKNPLQNHTLESNGEFYTKDDVLEK